MNTTIWITMLIIAIATFFMRMFPIVWLRQRAKKQPNRHTEEQLPLWITILGPAMIAAMFGTSLIPAQPSTDTWLATGFGIFVTAIFWYRKRSLGLPVLMGVIGFGLVVALLS